MLPIRTILHPTDFSEHSKPAFEMACALARDYHAGLVVVHVTQSAAIFAPDGIAVAYPTEDSTEPKMRLAAMHAPGGGVTIDHRLVEGDPHHLMHLGLVHHLRHCRIVLRQYEDAQPIGGRARPARNLLQHDFILDPHPLDESLVNSRFRGEETIDIGRRHAEFPCNIGHGSLGEAVVTKQPFRLVEDAIGRIPAAIVGFGGGGQLCRFGGHDAW